MQVLDEWVNDDNSVEVKKEPEDPAASSSSRASASDHKSTRHRRESDRSDNTNRDPRRNNQRDKENDRRSNSPNRNKRPSPPYRRPPRFSPPPRRRSRSPQRPPRRNLPNSLRPSFLEEITKAIPELRQDSMHNNNNRFNNPNMYGYGMDQIMPGAQFMPQPGFQQPFHPTGPFPMMNNFGQPMNPFMNQMMPTPHMATGNPLIFPDHPMPVPAPMEIPMQSYPPPKSVDPRLKPAQNPEPPPIPKGIDHDEAKKRVSSFVLQSIRGSTKLYSILGI